MCLGQEGQELCIFKRLNKNKQKRMDIDCLEEKKERTNEKEKSEEKKDFVDEKKKENTATPRQSSGFIH